jgi:hypothetical protein
MTDQNRDAGSPEDTTDERSDIQQAVEARSDAVARGEGGKTFDGLGGESGASGVVKNQEGNDQ